MKKNIICIVLTFITMATFAQTNSNSISVNGTHIFTIQPEYEANMTLSLSNVYYDAPGLSLPELKATYLSNLTKAGISKNAISEDNLAYAMMGFEKEGTTIKLKTKSLEELKLFLSIKALGVTKSDVSFKAVISDEEEAYYSKLAYDQAKAKAEAIAAKIGRKVGKAIAISNSNSNTIRESLYYATEVNEREYLIAVSFELL